MCVLMYEYNENGLKIAECLAHKCTIRHRRRRRSINLAQIHRVENDGGDLRCTRIMYYNLHIRVVFGSTSYRYNTR